MDQYKILLLEVYPFDHMHIVLSLSPPLSGICPVTFLLQSSPAIILPPDYIAPFSAHRISYPVDLPEQFFLKQSDAISNK